jgi:hypothetical protein
MFRKKTRKGVEANLKLDKADIKVVEIKIDGELVSWGYGVPKRTEKKVEVGGAITPTPEAVAGAAWEKDLEWKFWYNRDGIPKWLNERQVMDTTAMNTTAVSGSMTPKLGTFSPWIGGEIKLGESSQIIMVPREKGLSLIRAEWRNKVRWRKHSHRANKHEKPRRTRGGNVTDRDMEESFKRLAKMRPSEEPK